MKIKNLIAIGTLSLLLTGCSANTVTYSTTAEVLDENGYFKDVVATDYVTLCDYSSISISDEAVQKVIDSYLESNVTTNYVDSGTVEADSTVAIDYVGTIDGKEFSGSAQSNVLVSSDNAVLDTKLFDSLVGKKVGDTFNFTTIFNTEEKALLELNGKEVNYEITINHIVKYVPSTWNDEFVANNLSSYGWTTTAEAEAGIYSSLYMTEVLNQSKVSDDVPEKIVNFFVENQYNSIDAYARTANSTVENILSTYYNVSTYDEFAKVFHDEAVKLSKSALVYQAIAETKHVVITDDDVSEYFRTKLNTDDYSDYEKTLGKNYIRLVTLEHVVTNSFAK